MNFFANTNIWKRIVIVVTVILSIMLIAPKPVEASVSDVAEGTVTVGGALLQPICQFLVGIGDGVMDIIHDVMLKQTSSVIRIPLESSTWEKILNFFIGVVVAVVIAAILFSGPGSMILAPIGTLIASSTAIGIAKVAVTCLALAGGAFGSIWMYEKGFWGNNELVLPTYAITPEEIFKNDEALPLFSVNFFDLDKRTVKYHYKIYKRTEEGEVKEDNTDSAITSLNFDKNIIISKDTYEGFTNKLAIGRSEQDPFYPSIRDKFNWVNFDDVIDGSNQIVQTKIVAINGGIENNADITNLGNDIQAHYIICPKDQESGEPTDYIFRVIYKQTVGGAGSEYELSYVKKPDNLKMQENGTYVLEGTTSSNTPTPTPTPKPTPTKPAGMPEEDYKKWLAMLERGYEQVGDEQEGEIYPMSTELSKFVFAAYRALRYIAMVGMMSVLVYIGIRIVLSSSAGQKAKYKELLGDWVVGMVLLFTMHYIMYFSNIFVDELSKFLNSVNPSLHIAYIPEQDNKIQEKLETMGYKPKKRSTQDKISRAGVEGQEIGVYRIEGEDDEYIEWYTNLMGALRINLNYNCDGDSVKYVGYTVMFIVMIIYTLIFMWTYVKRVIYMAFLTLISPLVALTYPIDKITDGKAQGFNFWFREYIFNLLLQPMHLLLYTILVSAAISFAGKNMIYSLVALGFIGSAEKIMRQMFNFQKANTPGVFAGPAGAAATFAGMRWLLGKGPQGEKDGGSGKGGSGGKDESDTGKLYNRDKTTQVQRLEGMKIEGEEDTGGGDTARLLSGGGNSPSGEENQSESGEPPIDLNEGDNLAPEGEGDLTPQGDERSPSVPIIEGAGGNTETAVGQGGTVITGDASNMGTPESGVIQADYGNYGDFQALDDIPEGDGMLEYGTDDMEHPEERAFRRRYPGTEPNPTIENLQQLSRYERMKSRAKEFGTNAKNSRPGKVLRGIGGALNSSMDAKIDNFDRKAAKKKIFKAVGGLALGAAAVTVGVASGVASGSAKTTFQNAGIGAAIGWKAGKGLGNATDNKIERMQESYRRARYTPEEYKAIEDAKNQKKFVNNRENIRKFADKTNRTERQAKEWLEKHSEQYRRAGINDVEEMAAIEKTLDTTFKYYDSKTGKVKTGSIKTRDHAIGLYQIAKTVGSESIQGKDNTNKAIQRIQNMGFEDKETAEAMFYGSTVYGDIKNNIYNKDDIRPKAEWNKEDAEKREAERIEKEKQQQIEQKRAQQEQDEKTEKEEQKKAKEEAEKKQIEELEQRIKKLQERSPEPKKKKGRNVRKSDVIREPVGPRTKSKNRLKEAQEAENVDTPIRQNIDPVINTRADSTDDVNPVINIRPEKPVE